MITNPAKTLDNWIENRNCIIEELMEQAPWGSHYLLYTAINILSDVVEFFNGTDPGALAQSG